MNILAIFIAATLAFISAFLWNGPVFGKFGQTLSGNTGSPQPPKISQIVLNYVVFLITAFVMSGIFWIAFSSPFIGEKVWYKGVIIAIWLWIGFIVTTTSIEVIWKDRSWKLWIFECASALVVFSIMGAVLGVM